MDTLSHGRVEADYSAASFFLVASALGAPVECLGLNPDSLQGDSAILRCLESAGADITSGSHGGITVSAKELRAFDIDVGDIPDLVPPLAAAMTFCRGESHITNAGRLRLKESDRLAAVSTEINRLGGKVICGDTSLTITGVTSLKGGICSSWNDHRIAMMLAVLSLKCSSPVSVDNPDCVRKSYPNFWNDFKGDE